MSYVNKYKETIYCAKLLYEKGKFNSAVNRYYYFIYQNILEYNEKYEIEITNEELKSSDSHTKTIAKFCNAFKKNTNINDKTKKHIRNILINAKELRNTADYETLNVSNDEIKSFISNIEILADLGVIDYE